jgi:hypothetical protein
MNRTLILPVLLLGALLLASNAQAQGCGTTVYDTGGAAGQYGNNQNLTWTYCPPAGQVITITFTAFNTEAGFDYLSVHNGATNGAPQLGLFSGTALPPSITGTVPGGCITLWFTSDASVPAAGWIANITCTTPPPPAAVCGTTVYDPGGAAGNYANNANYTVTYCPSVAGQVVTMNFTQFSTEANFDFVTIYNGPSTASPTMGTYSGTGIPGPFTSTHPGGCLTLVFTSDASVPFPGWAANITCTTPPPPAAVCGTTVYDPGGAAGNYANNANYTVTYCPSVAGQVVTMNFTQFSTEANFDFVTIYNGPSTASPTMGTFSGTGIPGPFTSTHPGGCLTLVFTSDGLVPFPGWAANISCATPPPPPSGDCIYVLSLQDSFGDGWGTSFVGVSINGGPYTNYTVGTLNNTILIGVDIGDLVVLNYNASGTFQFENSFTLGIQGAGDLFSSGTPPAAGIIYTGTVDCVPPPSPPEDCVGALTICSNQAITNNPANTGNVVDLTTANMGCLSNAERQGTWYVFSPSSPGNVAFTIDPLNPLDDYDFAIWGPYPPGTTPGSICPPPGVPLRCSYAAPSGPTGLNYTAIDDSETALGDKWVNDIAVGLDQVYLMYISNWSQSGLAFNLTWQLTNGASLDCTVLPVTWIGFEGRAVVNTVELDWTTGSEQGSDHFVVERSVDGHGYAAIGQVQAMGNTSNSTDYHFVDRAPAQGLNYYRLKQVDLDGGSAASPVVPVMMGSTGAPFPYPNPAQDRVDLLLPTPLNGTASVLLLDMQGREVHRWAGLGGAGHDRLALSTTGLMPGAYLLQMRPDTGEPLEPIRLMIH